MSFTITIIETTGQHAADDSAQTIKRYEQTVDVLDLPAVIAAVNRKPRKPRERKTKAEA